MFEETANNEDGHAVISKTWMPQVNIEHLSLTPKENKEHVISNKYSDVQENMTVKDFKDKISVSLAGKAAQMKQFVDI